LNADTANLIYNLANSEMKSILLMDLV